MAMAAASAFSICSIPATRTPATTKLPCPSSFSRSFPCSYTIPPSSHLRLSAHLSCRSTNSSIISAAATTSIEADLSPVSANPSKTLPFRVGHGFDLHRLEPGYPLIIGGIDVPHERGCEAHSDGDVLLHCVVDAILGALGLPDIGQIFPDSDPKWKGCASSVFIKEAGDEGNDTNIQDIQEILCVLEVTSLMVVFKDSSCLVLLLV
ncbi:2-C-methyl-D-erythritol 2,4-cyclodiphosphate synthase [Quillaja saponaria]|uniref:2-C-methyl-D-erythritol 2,4-cyclodiphosphate synthase n=1 Tax=Quillaja saponaria TaxID=32244 RepID=A0AAD7KU37_QUISA|nr:2-C-methyl-D-erythritol 2,4-cyclodiphosphate synthase [Quillaja saponaria]